MDIKAASVVVAGCAVIQIIWPIDTGTTRARKAGRLMHKATVAEKVVA